MRTRRVVTSVVALTTSVGAMLVLGSPAHAATTVFCTQPFARAGYACFHSTGDRVSVEDLYVDGLRSVVELVTDDGYRECTDADGGNNGWTWCNFNFTEGRDKIVVFRVVSRNGANGEDQNPTVSVVGWVSGR